MDITATEFLKGISHELHFWKGFVQTPRFLNGWVKNTKTPELQQAVFNFITGVCGPNSKVLDVGSGVVSILNGTVPAKQITTADPLGDLYGVIFDYQKYKIDPPVPFPAEEMHWENEFDIVHMSNAIDHSQQPNFALWKLYNACKDGGYVILQGFENEGTFEKWQGFHQWDITVKDGEFKAIDGIGNVNITDQFKNKTVKLEYFTFESKTWYVWIIQK